MKKIIRTSKKKSLFLISIFLVAFFASVTSLSFIYLKKNPQFFWRRIEGFGGYAAGNQRLFRVTSDVYQPKTTTVGIEIFDLKTNSSQKIELFKQVSEGLKFTFFAEPEKSKIWIIQQTNSFCKYDAEKNEIIRLYGIEEDCTSKLYVFDSRSLALEYVTNLDFFIDKTMKIASIHPLAITKAGVLKLVFRQSNTDENYSYELVDYDTEKKTRGRNFTINPIDTYLQSKGVANENPQAELDSNDNLFFFSESVDGGTNLKLNRILEGGGSQEIKIPTDLMTNSVFWNAEMVIDKDKDILYYTNFSWDANSESFFFKYDAKRKKTELISGSPTYPEDDVRGIAIVDGNLMVGMYGGLAIYNPNNDKWTIVDEKYGLPEKSIRNIEKVGDDAICVRHESTNMSCLRVPYKLFSFMFGI